MVELFGLPGAGKSTLAARLDLPAETLRREDVVSARKALPPGRLVALALHTLSDWRWIWALAMLGLRMPVWSLQALDRLVRLAVTRTWLNAQTGLVVLDQGPLQAIWSIFFTQGMAHPPRRELARVLRLLYAGMDVVLVELAVRPELAATRINGRKNGGSRLDGLPVDTARSKLREVDVLPAELLAAVREAGLDLRSLSGERDLASLTGELQQILDQAAGSVCGA